MRRHEPDNYAIAHEVADVYKTNPILGALLVLNLALLGATGWYLIEKDKDIGDYIRMTRQDMQELRMKAIDLAANCTHGHRR